MGGITWKFHFVIKATERQQWRRRVEEDDDEGDEKGDEEGENEGQGDDDGQRQFGRIEKEKIILKVEKEKSFIS